MAMHELKTWPEYFAAILDGTKSFEVRYNDRSFAVGDVLHLREWDPDTSAYTGRSRIVDVTYLMPGGEWGVSHLCVVMSIAARRDPQIGGML